MSEMNFEDIMNEWARSKAQKDPRVPQEMNPKDYTSIVYLRNGEAYEFPGTMAMDVGFRIAVVTGEDSNQLTAFNADHVLYYEVVLTASLQESAGE